jgi:hypothetical protein
VITNRRFFVVALALSAALAGCHGGSSLTPSAPNPAGAMRAHGNAGTSTTLSLVNNSGTALKNIYLCYYGLNPVNGTPLYLADTKGTLKKSVANSKPTTSFCIPAAASLVFPQLNAARLYVSYGKPLTLSTGANARPVPPAPALPTDANYKIKWDFFELSYLPQAGSTTGLFNFNLSVLQSANLPMQFAVKGVVPGTATPVAYKRGWIPGGYTKFLASMQANAAYKKTVLAGTNRVLSPGTAIQAFVQKQIPRSIFAANYFKKYVDATWTKYAGTTLTFIGDPPAGSNKFVTWTGTVVKGQFVFTPPAGNKLKLTKMVWNKPTSSDIFENNFIFCVSGCGAPNSQQENYALQIFGTLMGAYNRSVMLTTTTFTNNPDGAWCTRAGAWYQDPTTNYFSKYIHANSVQKLAYAFQSDDHCDASSFVAVWNPTNFVITLLAN